MPLVIGGGSYNINDDVDEAQRREEMERLNLAGNVVAAIVGGVKSGKQNKAAQQQAQAKELQRQREIEQRRNDMLDQRTYQRGRDTATDARLQRGEERADRTEDRVTANQQYTRGRDEIKDYRLLTREERARDDEANDVRERQALLQSIANDDPDPVRRMTESAGRFRDFERGGKAIKEAQSLLKERQARNLEDDFLDLEADPNVSGDPRISQRVQEFRETAKRPNVDHGFIRKSLGKLRDAADQVAIAREHGAEQLSQLADKHMKLSGAADALEQAGRGEDAKQYREAILDSRQHALKIQRARSSKEVDEHMGAAMKSIAGPAKEKGPPPVTDIGHQRKVLEQATKDLGPEDPAERPEARAVRLAQRMIQIDPRMGQPDPNGNAGYQSAGTGGEPGRVQGQQPDARQQPQQDAPSQDLVPPEIRQQQQAEFQAAVQETNATDEDIALIQRMKAQNATREQIKEALFAQRKGRR